MPNYTVNGSDLSDIADAIRAKAGTSSQLEFPDDFVETIGNISGGGITPTGTKQISITQNGTTTEDVTQYANAEVIVNVPTTGQAITGTFTGDDSATVNLQTGFEPDVVTITSNTSPAEAGFQGLILVSVAKGVVSYNFYHNSDSDANERQYGYGYRPGSDPWFNDAGAYRNCVSYSNGTTTVTNKTTNNANVYFADGVEYTWAAYKYNS